MSSGDASQRMELLITKYGPRINRLPHISHYASERKCTQCCRECVAGYKPANHVALLLERLGAGLQSLANLDNLFQTCPNAGQNMLHSWRSSIEEDIRNIQPFNARSVSSVNSATQWYVANVFHHKFSHTILFRQRSVITSNEISDQPVSARCKCWIQRKIPISLAAHCSLCA